jgi:hypothetical protein
VHKAGKYDRVAVDYEGDSGDAAAGAAPEDRQPVKAAVPPPPPSDSKLDARVQSLIRLIGNIQAMEAAMLELKYDTRKAPLGKLTKAQIRAGYEALKEIEALVTTGQTGSMPTRNPPLPLQSLPFPPERERERRAHPRERKVAYARIGLRTV